MSLTDLLNSVKKGIVKTSLGLSLVLSPLYGCGDESSNNNNSYSQDAGTPDSGPQWPECPLREYVNRCETLRGIYEVAESNCTNKYKEMSFEMDQSQEPRFESGEDCRPVYTVGIDKKTREKSCLGYYPFGDTTTGYDNQVEVDPYVFTKCDEEILKMRWNLGECQAWLRKTSPEPVEGQYSTGFCF